MKDQRFSLRRPDRRAVLGGLLGVAGLPAPQAAAGPEGVLVVAPTETAHVRLLLSALGPDARHSPTWPAAGTHHAVVASDLGVPAGFRPAGLVEMCPMVVIARPDVPLAEAADLGPWLRTGGVGIAAAATTERAAAMALAQAAGAVLRGLAAPGSAVAAVRAGAADLACVTAADAIDAARAGDVRALIVAGEEPLTAVWDAPAAVDAGLPLFSAASWSGLYTTGSEPVWAERLAARHADPAVLAALTEVGHAAPPQAHRSAEAHAALLASTRERYDALTRATGMTF